MQGIQERFIKERGVVMNFNQERGFGFLTREGGHQNVFVHVSELPPGAEKFVRPGMGVEFRVRQDARGRLKAVGVELL